ncbi:AAA family ATPase [Modestobacter lapidis]|nr:AAA domain-containing protein [Modestobacter lapidis]
MPYPSPQLLAVAADDLAGSHPLTVVTIPALLHAAGPGADELFHDLGPLPTIPRFGTTQERPVLESFRLREESASPYLAVWQDQPSFIRYDYPGSTLQRLRTQDRLGQELFDIAWGQDARGKRVRIGTALRPTAGPALTRNNVKRINRLSLAVWLGRDQDLATLDDYLDWFDDEYPLASTDLQDFYPRAMPRYAVPSAMQSMLWTDQPSNEDILEALPPISDREAVLALPSTSPTSTGTAEPVSASGVEADDDLRWTRDFCAHPLRDADVQRLRQRVLADLATSRITLPDAEALVTRCVTALLVGHLVLQGPPGTGKTTLARILADAFDVRLLASTATSEWSPFHVVGGLRPAADGSLQPSYGKVADAALKCAIQVRDEVTAEDQGDDTSSGEQARRWQGTWLLIDEFNRADIDKAIGSLYTVLSSCDPANLERSPIDLWFETEGRQQLWVPARFRIIAAMNDLDTSFVNPISQGLTRRFQFITVGTPVAELSHAGTNEETESSLQTAYDWLSSTYGAALAVDSLEAVRGRIGAEIALLQRIVADLRRTSESVAGWPIGTAQLVDVFRVILLQTASGIAPAEALDWAIADRVVPQMGQLDDLQLQRASELFAALPKAQAALQHLVNPHGV